MGEVPRITHRAHSSGRDAQPAVEPDVRELFVAEYPALVRTLALIVRDRTAAEDLAQDTFVQLLRHWPRVATYDAPVPGCDASLSGWPCVRTTAARCGRCVSTRRTPACRRPTPRRTPSPNPS